MNTKLGNYDLPFEAILVKVRDLDKARNPDIAGYKTLKLFEGQKAYRVATYWTIRDRHSGEIHHHSLTLRTFRRYKSRGWEVDDQYKITLSDKDDADEIQKLLDFLVSIPHLTGDGEYIIVNSENMDDRLSDILKAVTFSERSIDLLSQILTWVQSDARANMGLIQLASADVHRSKALVAALNYGRYAKALAQFKHMINQDLPERSYQDFLEENYWMFGSEYSELIDKRSLALGIQLDFPLRRTVDGYLDIIEIKTPLNGKSLFSLDKSHDNLCEITEVTKAISQARKYIDTLTAEQFRIELREKLKVDKVRARVVIGRDTTKEQVNALRRLNADLRSTEIITYDQLTLIAERILKIMVAENPLLSEVEIEEENFVIDDEIVGSVKKLV